MPARNPLPHASGIMPGQPESQILPFEAQGRRFAQNDRGGENDGGGRNGGGHAMHMHGISLGSPITNGGDRFRGNDRPQATSHTSMDSRVRGTVVAA